MIGQSLTLFVLTVGTACWHAHKRTATDDTVGAVVTLAVFLATCLADVAFIVSCIRQATQ